MRLTPSTVPQVFAMLWLHQLQQRLAITRREALALFSILSLFLVGLAIQFIQRQNVPPLSRSGLFADSTVSHDLLASPSTIAPDTPASHDVLEATAFVHSPKTDSLDAGETPQDTTEEAERLPDQASASSQQAGELINLNAATSAELQELRGIGPSLAGRIVAYREKRPFQSVDQLTNVRGIGPKTLARIRPQLTVSP